jgi:hypothetical protein
MSKHEISLCAASFGKEDAAASNPTSAQFMIVQILGVLAKTT